MMCNSNRSDSFWTAVVDCIWIFVGIIIIISFWLGLWLLGLWAISLFVCMAFLIFFVVVAPVSGLVSRAGGKATAAH
jgi:hypothetical protein